MDSQMLLQQWVLQSSTKTSLNYGIKKAAVKGLTPIETKEEALYFLYLMEYVVPDDNFNEKLCEKKGIYKIYTDTMTPTIIKRRERLFCNQPFLL